MQIYYDRKDEWKKIVDNGMAVDYSWNVSADKYIHLYQELTGIYDLPEKKKPARKTAAKTTKKQEKKETFEDSIKADAEAAAKAAADGAKEPERVEVKNPFEEEKAPAAKKTTTKKTTRKTAAKKTTTKKTTAKSTAKKAVKEEPAKAEPVKAEKAEPAKTAKTEKTEQKRHGTEKSVSFLRLAAAEMKIRQEIWRIHPTKCRKEGQKLARMTKSC